MSGAEIMGLLLDLSPEGRELPEPEPREPERRPNDLELFARGVGESTDVVQKEMYTLDAGEVPSTGPTPVTPPPAGNKRPDPGGIPLE